MKRLVPMAHVKDVRRSIAHYELLGLHVLDTHPKTDPLVWARLEGDGASLMVALADGPFDPAQQAVLFYLYADDVRAAHAHCQESGLAPGPLTFPFYCPDGEFRLEDPDGYVVMVTHA